MRTRQSSPGAPANQGRPASWGEVQRRTLSATRAHGSARVPRTRQRLGSLSPWPLLGLWLCACAALWPARGAHAQLQTGFYAASCPRAERIIREAIRPIVTRDPTRAAALLRLHFHDCFVEGCDGSVLLDNVDGVSSEKEAAVNFGLAGFEIVDSLKAKLEAECPGTVSCADVLALAARDAVRTVGGPYIPMRTGRRDGFRSLDAMTSTLPVFTDVNGLIATFGNLGLSAVDMVALSGAHTIGQTHCLNVENRLVGNVDDLITPQYRNSLGRQCFRRGTFQPTNTVANDPVTTSVFDNQYYINLQNGQGTFITDSILTTDRRTKFHVNKYAGDRLSFFRQFNKSMLRMSEIGVLTGGRGEVRFDCHVTNEY